MEPPHSLNPNVVRDGRMNVLRAFRPIIGKDVERMTVRAQYGSGICSGIDIPDYRHESGVPPDSTIETYVALKLFVENWRWAGVPFYLRTGESHAETSQRSRGSVQGYSTNFVQCRSNRTTGSKCPGVAHSTEGRLLVAGRFEGARHKSADCPVEMNFNYNDAFVGGTPEAYERLLLDVMVGDASLFMRRDAVEASWAWITLILDGWKEEKLSRLPDYPAGTWGPTQADCFIQADGRAWRTM